jgi:putative peptidoglycan lipid II flippase
VAEQQHEDGTAEQTEPSVVGSSAIMAAGTVVSRLSGFVRTALLAAALGTGLHADIFNVANTVPNMLYILLAGGVFNAVLVPQLVRAIRNDADGGEAYTNRVITLAALFLAGVSIVLVVAAPLVMRVLVNPQYFTADLAAERDSMIAFARYCLPQVFFYGMFVLVGQVLNARRSFGPMMWAPIANNVISVLVIVAYLLTVGTASKAEQSGPYSSGAEALLGLGSTLGIAVQFLILIPYLKRSGFSYRPRFDFRNSGLGHTLRLAVWTVLFVVVNQVAYTVVVRLASGGTAAGTDGTGYTVYSYAFLLVMVPHSIITVSLATAVLPRLSGYAAAGDLRAVASSVNATMRSTFALVLPVLALIPVVAPDLVSIIWAYGSARNSAGDFVPSVSLFALGLFFFTSHYLVLRGFYALEQNRRVFWIQCVIATVNIVAAVALTRDISPADTAPRLVLAYALSYAVGAAISFRQLAVQTGGLGGRALVRFAIRIAVVVGASVGLAWLTRWGLDQVVDGSDKLSVLVRLVVVGAVGMGSYLALARLFRLSEVTEVTRIVTDRIRPNR